ncbi:hypothetical protein [Acidaminococcus massiliensis]|uniref:hypothetical protein n=1 Tax=Acidaminococcus massiliensis TaxID=1852375 RepID=UPI001C9D066E|nr:hypothetical protein [Acidaminococcus massiliensis]
MNSSKEGLQSVSTTFWIFLAFLTEIIMGSSPFPFMDFLTCLFPCKFRANANSTLRQPPQLYPARPKAILQKKLPSIRRAIFCLKNNLAPNYFSFFIWR